MLMYHYTWGTESILSSSVTVIRESKSSEIYNITFEQEGFDTNEFYHLLVTGEEISREEITDMIDEQGLVKSVITVKVREKNNPKPETLFVCD